MYLMHRQTAITSESRGIEMNTKLNTKNAKSFCRLLLIVTVTFFAGCASTPMVEDPHTVTKEPSATVANESGQTFTGDGVVLGAML